MLVSDIPALRDYWYPIAYSDEITTEPQPFRMFAENFVAWRTSPSGTVSAAFDECPHRSARLSQGWVTDGCLVCPYHGWRFDAVGACVEIPANEPGLPIPSRARLNGVLAAERYGMVWACIGEPRAGIPDLIEADDPDYVLIHELMETWTASAPRVIDNALDVSHVAWVHRDSVGSAANPRLSDYTIEREGEVLRFSVSYLVAVNEQQKKNLGITEDLTKRSTHAELVQPLVFRGVLEYHANGLRHVLFKTATPVDDDTTLFCQFIARNDRPDVALRAEIAGVDRIVQSEDKVLLEGVKSDFPGDVTTELHTKSDRMTVEYRRILADLASVPTRSQPNPAATNRR
jgi:phenylpropionate dioxygenase-like ring-hydroxylating dioxygenase large terminal subunit